MTTLIALYHNRRCVGRCDARCYQAHDEHCHCICGGINHGVGRQKALQQTRLFLSDLPLTRKESHDYHARFKTITPLEVLQRPLLPKLS
jgi:hypothetical protein